MPADWSDQLQAAYPKRSGPMGWKGMRLMLAVRRALQETDWNTILEGVKRYAAYCQKSGKEGSEYVKTPKAFFEEGIYLEELQFSAPIDHREAERQRQLADRERCADEAGSKLGLSRYPQESIAAFETRISLARSFGRQHPAMAGEDRSSEVRARIRAISEHFKR